MSCKDGCQNWELSHPVSGQAHNTQLSRNSTISELRSYEGNTYLSTHAVYWYKIQFFVMGGGGGGGMAILENGYRKT